MRQAISYYYPLTHGAPRDGRTLCGATDGRRYSGSGVHCVTCPECLAVYRRHWLPLSEIRELLPGGSTL